MKKYLSVLLLIAGISTSTTAQIDYESEIQPIFNSNCGSCHGSNGGVNLSSYSALLSSVGNNYGADLIVAGDPDASGLVDKIEASPQFGNRMPTTGPLSDSEIALIRTWISEGANQVPTNNEIDAEAPKEFQLLGNYPNPFNPSTELRFEVPRTSQYTISVYSVHGSLIKELVGTAQVGEARVTLNLGANPTGVYFYQVIATSNGAQYLVGTGQMTLIK